MLNSIDFEKLEDFLSKKVIKSPVKRIYQVWIDCFDRDGVKKNFTFRKTDVSLKKIEKMVAN